MGEKPTVTCDPGVLWEPSFWNKFVLDGYAPKGKYVLIYAVNPDKRNISDGIEYAKKKGIPAYFINFYTPIRGTKTIRPTNVILYFRLLIMGCCFLCISKKMFSSITEEKSRE